MCRPGFTHKLPWKESTGHGLMKQSWIGQLCKHLHTPQCLKENTQTSGSCDQWCMLCTWNCTDTALKRTTPQCLYKNIWISGSGDHWSICRPYTPDCIDTALETTKSWCVQLIYVYIETLQLEVGWDLRSCVFLSIIQHIRTSGSLQWNSICTDLIKSFANN